MREAEEKRASGKGQRSVNDRMLGGGEVGDLRHPTPPVNHFFVL